MDKRKVGRAPPGPAWYLSRDRLRIERTRSRATGTTQQSTLGRTQYNIMRV